MKTDQPTPVCTVQSSTDHAGRRTLKFIRVASDTGFARAPVKRRKPSFHLKLLVAPEAAFNFEPVIKVRSGAKA